LQVTQVFNAIPRQAELQLILRQLPDALFLDQNLEPFLTHLQRQLTLSIPSRNLTVTGSEFRLRNSDIQNRTVDVVYFFNVDLEDTGHAELMISGQGNPILAPVPVVDDE
jgi:hypothetical protein